MLLTSVTKEVSRTTNSLTVLEHHEHLSLFPWKTAFVPSSILAYTFIQFKCRVFVAGKKRKQATSSSLTWPSQVLQRTAAIGTLVRKKHEFKTKILNSKVLPCLKEACRVKLYSENKKKKKKKKCVESVNTMQGTYLHDQGHGFQ